MCALKGEGLREEDRTECREIDGKEERQKRKKMWIWRKIRECKEKSEGKEERSA
jgi:hypothetical protein